MFESFLKKTTAAMDSVVGKTVSQITFSPVKDSDLIDDITIHFDNGSSIFLSSRSWYGDVTGIRVEKAKEKINDL